MSHYLLMSDIHFHNWTTFATTNPNGVNSRLQIIIDEMQRAVDYHLSIGGDKILIVAGDVFHTRGSVATSVMNPVLDAFKKLIENGFDIRVLSGNHDLESKESAKLTSAVTALEQIGAYAYSASEIWDAENICFIPWFSEVSKLKEEIEKIKSETKDYCNFDLIIHAPIDDVIFGLPEHGLTADYLAGLGFKRVFSGHYHNHKDFGNGVYSIGATTHQTFSDVNSLAGFLSVKDDEVIFRASHAPKFVDINSENFDDAQFIVDGNYVRCRIQISKESEVEELRKEFEGWGAKGVIINQIKSDEVLERDAGASIAKAGSVSIEASIGEYAKAKGYSSEVVDFCIEILNEVEEI